MPGIRPGAGFQGASGNRARFWLSTHGQRVASHARYAHYDPEGLVARLSTDAGGIDTDLTRYLAEAPDYYRHRFFLSAGVMTGRAAEKAIILLINSVKEAISYDTPEMRQVIPQGRR